MIKERAWPVKAMYILIAAALAISLMIMVAPAQKASAACGDVKAEWDRVSTPSGQDLVLAPDSIIWDYAVAEAGDMAYAVWEGALLKDDVSVYGTWLLKSDDGAATWSDITDAVKKEIAKDLKLASADDVTPGMFKLGRVATDGESADFLAVALSINGTTVHVFTSTDGGATFKDTDKDGVTGIANLDDIYDFAVSPEVGGAREIAIAGFLGGNSALLRYTDGGWEDATAYDGWDNNGSPTATAFNSAKVVDIEFSPDWAQDDSILAVTVRSDLKTVDLQTGTWGETETEGWNSKSVAGIDAVKIITTSAVLPSLGRWVAGMTLPSDYSARNSDTRYTWVWVNYGSTGNPAATIFVVKNKKAEKVGPKGQIEDEELWLTSISYQGTIATGKAIAGVLGDGAGADADCCTGVRVFRNSHISSMDICCYGWEEACKPPTGRYAMDAFYVRDDKAYAVAVGKNLQASSSYDESAWSVSFDDGDTWNQLSLIDTYIDYLSDVAVSPDCNKTFLVSVNVHKVTIGYGDDGQDGCGCDSVWVYADEFPEAGYSEYSGHWLRTYCFELTYNTYNQNDHFWGESPYYGERGLLRLVPAPEETDGMTVYLVDRGTSTVYWNDVETLACWNTGSAVKTKAIVDLDVKDATTIYALGADGYVAMSDDNARGWHTTVDTHVDSGWTIAVHGEDILVGGQNGKVSYSDDGGETFALLEKAPKAFDGLVTVAFDSYFDTNNMVYAALAECTNDNDNGIYRWIIGTSETWEDMGALPYDYTGLVLSYPDGNDYTSPDTGGVLYASYIGAYTASDSPPSCTTNMTWMTGVARSLNPAKTIECLSCVEWDYLTVGLTGEEYFRMVPDALKSCGCMDPTTDTKLFAIGKVDTGYDMEKAKDFTVWMFDDCYAKKAPELAPLPDVIPADPCSCYNAPFSIAWDCLCDACYYEIQYDLDSTFGSPMTIKIAPTPGGAATSYLFPGGATAALFSCETTYYLRIRASQAGTCQVIHSQWSDPAVEFTVAPSTGAAAIDLISPAPGALNQPTKNVGFSWDLTATADAFSWVLSANADLSSPLDSKTGLTGKATSYAGTLTHGTTYYWQVTAYNGGTAVSMSAIGTFTTGPTGAFCAADGMCFETQAELQAYIASLAQEPAATPFWVWVVIAIGAILVIVVIVLIFRTRRV
jgi:hypothetical protein